MTTQPADTPHPGWACCDPTQDLAAWIVTHRAHVAIQRRWGRACRTKANRLRRLATRELVRGNQQRYEVLDDKARALAWIANEWHERANLLGDRIDAIAGAHAWRLPADLMPPPPAKPPRRVVPPAFHLYPDLRRIHQMPPGPAKRAAHAGWVADQIAKLPPRADT